MRMTKFGSWFVLVAVLAAFALPAQATLYTLTNGNSEAVIDPTSQAGMFDWTVEGIPQLFQQWFWYRIGNTGGQNSIDTLSAPAVTQVDASTLTISYSGLNGLGVAITYLLRGGTPNSGGSDIGESITLVNNNSTSMALHFFQYSDFDLDGTAGNQVVNVLNRNTVDQTDLAHGVTLSETVATPGVSFYEANFYANTLNHLNSGSPYTLNNQASAGPGDVTWAFQWDFNIAAHGSKLISKDKNLQVFVPEPASILGFGAVLLLVGRKLQKKLAA